MNQKTSSWLLTKNYRHELTAAIYTWKNENRMTQVVGKGKSNKSNKSKNNTISRLQFAIRAITYWKGTYRCSDSKHIRKQAVFLDHEHNIPANSPHSCAARVTKALPHSKTLFSPERISVTTSSRLFLSHHSIFPNQNQANPTTQKSTPYSTTKHFLNQISISLQPNSLNL